MQRACQEEKTERAAKTMKAPGFFFLSIDREFIQNLKEDKLCLCLHTDPLGKDFHLTCRQMDNYWAEIRQSRSECFAFHVAVKNRK